MNIVENTSHLNFFETTSVSFKLDGFLKQPMANLHALSLDSAASKQRVPVRPEGAERIEIPCTACS